MMHGPLPAKLRVLRARQGLTLIEAAEKIGIGRDTLSDLERGNRRPGMPTLAKVAEGYGVPVEELLPEVLAQVRAKRYQAVRAGALRYWLTTIRRWIDDRRAELESGVVDLPTGELRLDDGPGDLYWRAWRIDVVRGRARITAE